jgi:hypothetical protein
MRMAVLPALSVAAAALAFLGGCGEETEPGEATVTAKPFSKLDCGHGRAGSKAAFRQFAEILASGDEAQIRAMLVDQPRFAWISAQGGVTGPEVSVRRDPDAAAAAVADRGGLPFQITRFQNIDPPGRATDAGFRGRWDQTRGLFGKGVIDCERGKAIVLSVGVRPGRQ